MVVRCRCGVMTNFGKNCSKCQDLETSLNSDIDWGDYEEIELKYEEIDQDVLDFIENFREKRKAR